MTAYTKKFLHADDVIKHLNTVVPKIDDHLLVQKYVGFVAVAAVTVYELAIKDIFVRFAKEAHPEFGDFVEEDFNRINGQIRRESIQGKHLKKFGGEYQSRFKKIVENRDDLLAAYDKVITARHSFVHGGNHSNNTYEEITEAYENGKEVIRCLAEAMTR